MDVTFASAWTEAVFHVLAHVNVGRISPSCHDGEWVRWASEKMGPVAERSLADDAAVLASTLAAHEPLGRAQAIAWVFASAGAARAVSA